VSAFVGALVCAFVFDVVVENIAFGNALDTRQTVAIVHTDQRDALRGAAHFADFRHPRAHQHTAIGDPHDLIGRHHQHGAHNLAVALGGLDGDHALGAAAMTGVLPYRRALAVTVLGCREHAAGFVVGHQQGDHRLSLFEGHAAHTARIAAHGADVVFIKPH